ncbi:hypothetical protein ABH917_001545 [Thermobifida halotolerans]
MDCHGTRERIREGMCRAAPAPTGHRALAPQKPTVRLPLADHREEARPERATVLVRAPGRTGTERGTQQIRPLRAPPNRRPIRPGPLKPIGILVGGAGNRGPGAAHRFTMAVPAGRKGPRDRSEEELCAGSPLHRKAGRTILMIPLTCIWELGQKPLPHRRNSAAPSTVDRPPHGPRAVHGGAPTAGGVRAPGPRPRRAEDDGCEPPLGAFSAATAPPGTTASTSPPRSRQPPRPAEAPDRWVGDLRRALRGRCGRSPRLPGESG